jgi:hypothetical protein
VRIPRNLHHCAIRACLSAIPAVMLSVLPLRAQYINTYHIVDTGQQQCYDNSAAMSAPQPGQAFYGQDAQHTGNQPSFVNNGDGTVTDQVTGLMWVKTRGSNVSWEKALADASTCTVGGHSDWRMPTIKELYSLIDFRGKSATTATASIPYLNTTYFDFVYGNTAAGERLIDCQDWSATTYVHLTMAGDSTAFGVNFADGRIKGYGKKSPSTGARVQHYVRYVRGNPSYGINDFVDNGDSTITDRATGLQWTKPDSRGFMNWSAALAWVQARNAANWLGRNDWRLPDAKELQSIIDYTRSPVTTNSAAIDPLFLVTPVSSNEYPYYWTSTTHLDNMGGVYLCFGRGLGWMQLPPSFTWQVYDVHGAGCQRSDPKTGSASNYPHGLGPQGDVIRIENAVRLVRSGTIVPVEMSSLRATALPDLRSVRIEWTTASEINNAGFFVERRGVADAVWQQVPGGFVAGHGSTHTAQEYTFTDRPPATGAWQYRLRQVDSNGRATLSHSVDVVLGSDRSAAPEAIGLTIHPNPLRGAAGETTAITFATNGELPVRLRIFDRYGRTVVTMCDAVLPVGAHCMRFDAAGLPAGMYFCRLETPTSTAVRRIAVLR